MSRLVAFPRGKRDISASRIVTTMPKRLVPKVGSISAQPYSTPVCTQSTQHHVFGVACQNMDLPCSMGMHKGWEAMCKAAFSLHSRIPRCQSKEEWGSCRCPFPACRDPGGSEQCGCRGQQILSLVCRGHASLPISHQETAPTQRFGKKEAKIGMVERLA